MQRSVKVELKALLTVVQIAATRGCLTRGIYSSTLHGRFAQWHFVGRPVVHLQLACIGFTPLTMVRILCGCTASLWGQHGAESLSACSCDFHACETLLLTTLLLKLPRSHRALFIPWDLGKLGKLEE